MSVKTHLSLSALKRLERVENDAVRCRHLRIVILGLEGLAAPAIAMGLSRRILQRWNARYSTENLPLLDDRRVRETQLPRSSQ